MTTKLGCNSGQILLLVLALVAGSEAPAAVARHVIHVSIDGLAARYLQFYLSNAPAQFATFNRIQSEGACTFNARCDLDSSETVPNHICLWTGRPMLCGPDMPLTVAHGYTNNVPGPLDTVHRQGNTNVLYKASVFDVVHDHGLRTAFFASKSRLAICERSYNLFNGAPDGVGEDDGRDKIDISMVNNGPVSSAVDALLQTLSNRPPHYSFIHLTEPDSTGHASGWGSRDWSNAVRTVDQQLSRIVAVAANLPSLSNNTALLVLSDHGGGGSNRYTHAEPLFLDNYTVPMFLWGPCIPAKTDLYSLFANRTSPGTNRVGYTEPAQPLRGGDTPNIALALLDLPPIPNSWFRPVLVLPECRLWVSTVGTGCVVTWTNKSASESYTLEQADTLSGNSPGWRPITNGITQAGLRCDYLIPSSTGVAWFRLRH